MIQEFEKLEELYDRFAKAYRDFAEQDRQARAIIEIVSRRIREAKRQTDEAVQQAKLTIADPSRSTAAQTAAAIRLEVLLSRSFPITPDEMAAMTAAVEAADAAYTAARWARSHYDEAHEEARRKIKEMRDDVFGNVPSAMDLMHTNKVLHDRLREVEEAAK